MSERSKLLCCESTEPFHQRWRPSEGLFCDAAGALIVPSAAESSAGACLFLSSHLLIVICKPHVRGPVVSGGNCLLVCVCGMAMSQTARQRKAKVIFCCWNRGYSECEEKSTHCVYIISSFLQFGNSPSDLLLFQSEAQLTLQLISISYCFLPRDSFDLKFMWFMGYRLISWSTVCLQKQLWLPPCL